MQRAVPDIGDLAGEQRPGLAPVGPVVVQHLAGALRRREPGARCARPGRSPRHRAGRSTIRCGRTSPSSRATAAGSVLLPQSSRCPPSSHRSPGCETGTAGGSGVSSSRGSGASPRSSLSISPPRSRASRGRSPSSARSADLQRQQLPVPAGALGELLSARTAPASAPRSGARARSPAPCVEPELAGRQHAGRGRR